MEPGFGLLRVALLAVRTGRDFLTDEVETAIRTAAVATAQEHAGAYEDDLADHDDVPEDFELPAPLDRDAYEAATDSLAERLVVELLFTAATSDSAEAELDEIGRVDWDPSPGDLAEAMREVAAPDLALDFDAVAVDFVDNLERAWAARSDEGLQLVVRYLQQIHTVLLDDRLEETDEKLAEQGFDRLEPSDLQDGLNHPEHCWRRSFTFTEVYDGIPIERERPGGERTKVADGLLEDLEDGNSVVLLGEPGAGKTTICKNVACRWYDREDTGAVLYRSHQKGAPVTDPDELVDAIRDLTGDGPVLVHVEDAARHDSVGVFEAIHELQGDADVSFLLNSRAGEWEGLTDVGGEQGVFDPSEEQGKFARDTAGAVEQRYVPRLDEREIKRILEQFESVAGKSVRADPAELDEQIVTDEGASPMLLLSYHLPIGDVGEPDGDSDSALHHNVEKAFERITEPDADAFDVESEAEADLLEKVALTVNVLNAAGIGVYEEFAYALADSESEHEFLDQLFNRFLGVLVFGERDDMVHWSHHEYWSEVYLQEHLDQAESESGARNTFERCVNAIFRTVESDEVRGEIQDRHGRGIERLKDIDGNETRKADEFTAAIFNIGVERPKLYQLYGDSDHSGIELPEPLSPEVEARCALWRFWMYLDQGEPRKAKKNLEVFREQAESTGIERGEAIYHYMKGWIEAEQGEFELALNHFEQSLKINSRLENELGIAQALQGLGRVALEKGDFDAARRRFEDCRKSFDSFEHQHQESVVLDNLGVVARNQGDYKAARKYHRQSLAIKNHIGDRSGLATSLGNLGNVALEQDDYKAAQEYYEECLAIEREIGDRAGTATALNNLGNVTLLRSDYEEARRYYEQSLDLRRKINDKKGEAQSLGSLGNVVFEQDDCAAAKKYYEESLTIQRQIGDQADAARSLLNLGNIAFEQEDFEDAREYYERAYNIFAELGAVRRQLEANEKLVRTCIESNEAESARKWCEDALAVVEASDLELETQRQQFERLLARVDAPEDPKSTYRHALVQILQFEPSTTFELLRQIWERRDEVEPGSEAQRFVLGAGVGVAALVSAFEVADFVGSASDVLADVEPHREDLSRPAAALYEQLSHGESSISPDELAETADLDPEAQQSDISEATVEDLEAQAYATLLRRLQFDEQLEEWNIGELYHNGLTAIARDDHELATRFLTEAWDRRDDVSEGGESYSEVYAAGVALAAHRTLLGEAADEEIDDILSEVESAEDDLPEPASVVLSVLRSEEPDVAPDDLDGDVDLDPENPDLEDLEAVVFARLFRNLDPDAALADADVDELYYGALVAFAEEEIETAVSQFAHVWERGQEDGEEIPTEALGAGVGLAAHLEMFDLGADAPEDQDEILAAIEPARDRLFPAVEAVFEHLHEGETDASPDELRAGIDVESDEDLDREEWETLVFSRLLVLLREESEQSDDTMDSGIADVGAPSTTDATTADGAETTTSADLDTYADGLEAILDDDPTTAVDALLDVWYQHDDIDEDADAFATTLAAGVLFAALTEGDAVVAGVRENALDAAETHRDRLSTPVDAVYEHLTDGDVTTTPEEVREMVAESDDEEDESVEPDTESLEAKASAHVLADLTD